MRDTRYQTKSQLKLQFDLPAPKLLDGLRPKGVVEKLADLLLEASGVTTIGEGADIWCSALSV